MLPMAQMLLCLRFCYARCPLTLLISAADTRVRVILLLLASATICQRYADTLHFIVMRDGARLMRFATALAHC